MIYRILADLVVVLHFAFILFVVFGGLLALKWKRCLWLHLPAAIWGALIEFTGWVCPLTPLENWLREQGGLPRYRSGFIEHYLLSWLYPELLTRPMQIALGLLVLLLNLGIYVWCLMRWRPRTGRHLS